MMNGVLMSHGGNAIFIFATRLQDFNVEGVVWMLAMKCRFDGWYLRNDIIWCKKGDWP